MKVKKLVVTGFGLQSLFTAARMRNDQGPDGRPQPELWADADYEYSDEVQQLLRDLPARRTAFRQVEHYEERTRGRRFPAADAFAQSDRPALGRAVSELCQKTPKLGEGADPFEALSSSEKAALAARIEGIFSAMIGGRLQDDCDEAFKLIDEIDCGDNVLRMSPSALEWITKRVQKTQHTGAFAGPRVRLMTAIRKAVDEDV